MSFNALFDGWCDVIKADWTFHQRKQTRVFHRPQLDVLQPAKKSQIHRSMAWDLRQFELSEIQIFQKYYITEIKQTVLKLWNC